jgi:hypothetical protein
MRGSAFMIVAAFGAAACTGDLDPEWQLDHDRIVAVRATPSRIPAGGQAVLDGLVAVKGGMTGVAQPEAAEVAPTAPPAFTGAVVLSNGHWVVNAPSEDVIENARQELGLADGTPVPLDVGIAFTNSLGAPMAALKTVYVDDMADNPTLGAVTVNGAAVAPTDSLTVPYNIDVPLTVDEDPTWDVEWYSSCGSLLDDNELSARIHVNPKDPIYGQLGVVVRDTLGGVVWQLWPITTTGVPSTDVPKSPTARVLP